MTSEIERLSGALERGLLRGRKREVVSRLVGAATRHLVDLDMGMIDGAVVPREKREQLVAEALIFARRCFDLAVALDPTKAIRWIAGLAVYQKPKIIDFQAWQQLAVERAANQESVDPDDVTFDLSSQKLPPQLSRAMQRVLALAKERPENHRLEPPAKRSGARRARGGVWLCASPRVAPPLSPL